jgi:23S rRNA pseudouridine1911/1915/1917 synthase
MSVLNIDEINDLSEFSDESSVTEFIIKVDANQSSERIDKFIAKKIGSLSRTKIQNSINAQCLTVNELYVKANYKVKGGDVIKIIVPKTTPSQTVVPENIQLNIVFEDQHLIVVNKPAGMVVHPAHGNWKGTLVNGLVYYLNNLPTVHGDIRPGIMHRIDKETSGLLLIAKTDEAAYPLAKQFFNHTIERTYQAIIWGEPKESSGTISNFIGRSKKDRKVMAVYDTVEEHGKWAVTHYKVLRSYKYVSLIECRLETGRTHQIRVHMRHLGHPIFNDNVYGGDRVLKGINSGKYKSFIQNCFEICNRQALHAKTLGFIHPVTHQQMLFDSDLPSDMAHLLSEFDDFLKNKEN